MDRNINLKENSPYQEGIISEMYERPDKSYFKEPSELKDLIDTTKFVQKFLPKQTDPRHYKEKSTKRYTITHQDQRNSSSLLNQSLHQRLVLSRKQITKQEKCHMQSRNLGRKINVTRFIIVQIGNYAR